MFDLPLTSNAAAGAIQAELGRRPIARRVLLAASVLVAAVALAVVYTHLSMTSRFNSDQASQALQGQDLWSGNVLLRSWTLSTISLYVPDLLLYGAMGSVLGLQPDMVHAVNAVMYTIAVLAGIALATRKGPSKTRAAAGLVTAVLLIAPQPGLGVRMLLVEGSHVGVTLLVVLSLIILDRAPSNYYRLVMFAAVMSIAVVSDGLAAVIGVAPVVVVCGVRMLRERRLVIREDLGIAAAAAGAIPFAALLGLVIRSLHGFYIYPLAPAPAHVSDIPNYAVSAVQGFLAMFGASLSGEAGALDNAAALVHVPGLILAFGSVCYVLWHWLRGIDADRIDELLALGIVADVAAFLLIAHGDTNRYLIPAFVFAAILAGRVGAALIIRRGVLLPAAAVAAASLAFLVLSLRVPAAPSIQPWETWLVGQHLYSGLGSYWQASVVTVDTGGRVTIRPVLSDGKTVNGYAWESKTEWYRATQLGDTRFVVFDVTDHQFGIDESSMESVFGPPVHIERFGNIEILVWDKNLAPDLSLVS